MDPLNPGGKAPSTQYAPAKPANWSPPPGNVATALDQLAADANVPDDAATTNYEPAVPGDWSPPPTQVAQALDQLATLAQGEVSAVTGTAPIASSGGARPNITISPATDLAAGSMSAADKTKLDSMAAGAAVSSVGATAPITSTGGDAPTIGITPATDLAAGSMSAADKTKLDNLTAATLAYAPAIPGNWSPVPTDAGPALDQLAARPAGGGGSNVFVYREAEPHPTGNVYATFDGAYTAAHAMLPSIIAIDNTLSNQNVVGNSLNFTAVVSSVVGSTATITGLTGMVPRVVGRSLGLALATNPGNNGLFPITAVLSPTSVQITNASAVAGDVNLSWRLVDGATAALTAGAPNLVLITGLTLGTQYGAQGGITPSMVGQPITFANMGNPGNNGTFTIFAFVSDSSVLIQNAAAVASDSGNWIIDSGTTASITAFDNVHGNVTLTGLSGITAQMVGYSIQVTGSAANDGFYTIETVINSTSLTYRNFGGSAPDANNGSIHWQVSQSNPFVGPINIPNVTASGLVGVAALPGNAFVLGNSTANQSNNSVAILAWVSATTVLLNPVNATVFTLPDPNNGHLWWHIGDDYDLSQITLTAVSPSGSATLNVNDGVTFNEGIAAVTGGLTVQGNFNFQPYAGTLSISPSGLFASELRASEGASISNNNTQAMFDLSFNPNVSYTLTLETRSSADFFAWFGTNTGNLTAELFTGGNIGNSFVSGTAGALSVFVYDTTVTPPTHYSGFSGTPGAGIFVQYQAKAATLIPFAQNGNPTPNVSGLVNAAGPYNVQVGTTYFDTGVQQPFWYTGSSWITFLTASSLAVGFGRSSVTSPSANIVAQQSSHASGFAGESTNVGVVLLGSDSHNGFNNINANYSGFLSGDGAILTAPYSVIAGGYENSIQGTTSQGYNVIAGGNSNSINDTNGYSFIGSGQNNNIATASGWHVLAGGYSNAITCPASVYGDVISGGANNAISGGNGSQNTISGGFTNTIVGATNGSTGPVASTIGGGYANVIGSNATPNAQYAVIGGGYNNFLFDSYTVIGGGYTNAINSGATYGTIAGGQQNTLLASALNGTIGGGWTNSVNDQFATIAGGSHNQVNNGQFAMIGGGQTNYIAGSWATIGGGFTNEIFATYAFIGGGADNAVGTSYSVVVGGNTNVISTTEGGASTIGGGEHNTISAGSDNVIAGGASNTITAGNDQTIGGGSGNTITGGNIGSPNGNTISGGASSGIGTAAPDVGFATVGGGQSHSVQANYGTVAGGNSNTVTGVASFVGGGQTNEVDGDHGAITGGQNNIIVSGARAFIAAGQKNQANADDTSILGTNGGSFVNGSTVMASGSFSALNGSSQLMEVQFRVSTAAIGTFPLGTGDDGTGATTQSTLFLPSNGLFNIVVDGVAMCNATNISYKAWTTRVVVQTLSSSTPTVLDQTDILAPFGTGPNAAGWSFAMVGTGANALQVRFTTGATDNTFVTLNLRIVTLAPPVPS